MSIEKMFEKPEIPVEVRIPEGLTEILSENQVSASRAIKLAVYALLLAETKGECSIPDVIKDENLSDMNVKRITVRIPVQVYDMLNASVDPMTVGSALSRISLLYYKNPEVVSYV